MRICIIGKFPPIQGGVAVRTYWIAHDLAARGHEVHVVTNAKEASPPFRIHMRRQDWKRCEASYPAAGSGPSGSVTMHWTDPLDRSQHYIPLASPFVSKLAGTAARVHAERPFDLIYSHYLEPYGIAGHLAADIAKVPHVVRMAGSDAGRLWLHPQLVALYDHVLRSARTVIASGTVAGRAIKHGVDPQRIEPGDRFVLPEELFRPEGPKLDLAGLRDEIERDDPELRDAFWGGFAGDLPFFGIYGKLGETKGSFALLAAMARLKQDGVAAGLVAMAHGWPALEQKFRARAEELSIADRILQIPFLPHWRVPEFLRSCLAVCCLEQDFPIAFHTPLVAREVLTCGACLVASTELIRKLPDYLQLPDGYGCVAIPDVQDVDALSARLAAMVRDPAPAACVAARGRTFGAAMQEGAKAAGSLETILKAAAERPSRGKRRSTAATSPSHPRFPVAAAVASSLKLPVDGGDFDLPQARDALRATERAIRSGDASLRQAFCAIQIEIALAEAELPGPQTAEVSDPLFRLRIRRWGLADGELGGLIPIRDPQLRLLNFDVSEMAQSPKTSGRSPRRIRHTRNFVIFAQANGDARERLLVSEVGVRILELSDGTRSACEIAREIEMKNPQAEGEQPLRAIEEMFAAGLLWLSEEREAASQSAPKQ
jgi:glycosyltransferase involved in cell wall biosynthesis